MAATVDIRRLIVSQLLVRASAGGGNGHHRLQLGLALVFACIMYDHCHQLLLDRVKLNDSGMAEIDHALIVAVTDGAPAVLVHQKTVVVMPAHMTLLQPIKIVQ